MRSNWRAIALSWLVLLVAVVLLVAGCGGGHHKKTPKRIGTAAPTNQLPQLCPLGGSYMGCATERPKPGQLQLKFGRPAGCLIPDDYEGNAGINYAAAKPFICGAIIKAGESDSHVDSEFFSRLATLRALHIWHAVYWFVRAGSCTDEAGLIIHTIERGGGLDSGPLIFDAEVPGSAGMVPCLESRTLAVLHRPAVVYTAPGTWFGNAADGDHLAAWIATFGSSHGCLQWTCSFVAWQFAAPPWVNYSIPGMGVGDVSVDQGITNLLPTPTPARDPYAIFPKARFVLAHGVKASEYNTYKTWKVNHCKNPARSLVCTSSHYHAELLRDREFFVATHKLVRGRWVPTSPRWGFPSKQQSLGSRFQLFSHIL